MNFMENAKWMAALTALITLGVFPVMRPSGRGAHKLAVPADGMLFTMDNSLSGNNVYAYTRKTDGTLTFLAQVPTNGAGSGADLNTQGALLLVPSQGLLYVPNASPSATSSISAFSYSPTGLTFLGTTLTGSNGGRPGSLTAFGATLYVLNTVGLPLKPPTIAGYTIGSGGSLTAIQPNGVGNLIAGGNPAEVGFTPSGTQIVATERVGALSIGVFPVQGGGGIGSGVFDTLKKFGPFGFAFDAKGFLDVAEGVASGTNGLFSYQISSSGLLTPISQTANGQQESSHVVVVQTVGQGGMPNQFAYVSNSVSNNITAYSIAASGIVSLVNRIEVKAGPKAIDMCVDSSSAYLYLLTRANSTVTGYQINGVDGSLTKFTSSTLPNLPPMSAPWGLSCF